MARDRIANRRRPTGRPYERLIQRVIKSANIKIATEGQVQSIT